jgi:hypothetical protein
LSAKQYWSAAAAVLFHLPSILQLNPRQWIRELLRLSLLMDAHSIDEFRDATSPAHHELIDILRPLA